MTTSAHPPTLDTVALLEKHRSGDSAALESLLLRHYPRIERIVSVRLRAVGAPQANLGDIVQETMIQAVKCLDRFEGREEARLIHWMARIAERQVFSLQERQSAAKRDRRREVAKVGSPSPEDESVVVDPVAREETPSVCATREEQWGILDRCIATLPKAQREVILLRDLSGASWKMCAAELRCSSVDTVRKLHQRARAKLRERFHAHKHLAASDSPS